MSIEDIRGECWQALLHLKRNPISYGDDYIAALMASPANDSIDTFHSWLAAIARFLAEDCYIPVVASTSLILRKMADGNYIFLLSVNPGIDHYFTSEVILPFHALQILFKHFDQYSEYSVVDNGHETDIEWKTPVPGFSLNDGKTVSVPVR